MPILDIYGTLIRADRITGFSPIHSISTGSQLCDWCWGFTVYTDIAIPIKLSYSDNSNKFKAEIERSAIINRWTNYLRKEPK